LIKNKIHNYDFLIVGAGLIGSLTALSLLKKNYKILIIEKNQSINNDSRTLAVNANSRDFLINLGLWSKISRNSEPINKIIIKDYINTDNLIFDNPGEPMGSVIYNYELLKLSRRQLEKKKCILYYNFLMNKSDFNKEKNFIFKNKKFNFKKIIFTLGKSHESLLDIKKFSFKSKQQSYVGFFNHKKSHNNIAYEYFTKIGPLAVLPAPNNNKNLSTFIFSSQKKINEFSLRKILTKNFQSTHGQLYFKNKSIKFQLHPHISKSHLNKHILIGDTLRSIHPVAGQGWNLGVKDIQKFCETLDQYSLSHQNFNDFYYSKRYIENVSYLSFTSLLTAIYDNQSNFNSSIIKIVFSTLVNFQSLRNLFIKQAMGRFKLV